MKTESIFVVDLQVGQTIVVGQIGWCTIQYIEVKGNEVYLETYRVSDNEPFIFEFVYPTFICTHNPAAKRDR